MTDYPLGQQTNLYDIQELSYQGKFIVFNLVFPINTRKTYIWNIFVKVKNSHEPGDFLGTIQWHSPWRKYCFYPAADCIFEEVCLTDIKTFITERTKDHKDRRKYKESNK